MTTKPAARRTMHATAPRTGSGGHAVPRSLADPEMKSAVDAFQKKVTRTPEAARDFLKDVGILTASGKLASSYGG